MADMNEFAFQEQAQREMKAREIARAILGVDEGAGADELKRAWREACKRHHPDHNPGDAAANRRLAAVNCAYRLLAHGEPCPMHLDEESAHDSDDKKDDRRSNWGYFLWWRDEYFG